MFSRTITGGWCLENGLCAVCKKLIKLVDDYYRRYLYVASPAEILNWATIAQNKT